MAEGLFNLLKTAAEEPWERYVRHDFVLQLRDGALPRATFLHYLRQDYLFLIHFARAWALAAVKTDRIDEMRLCAGTVHALIGEEMKLHIATCAAEGIGEAALAETEEAAATLAYTRFVTDAGLRGDLLDLLVALAPCVLGYGEIGRRLAGETGGPPKEHPYRDWIDTYAGPDYLEVCQAADGLIETVAARRLGGDPRNSPRWPELCRIFAIACRLEADFWSMGLAGARNGPA